MMISPLETKYCESCLEERPITEFRRRSTGREKRLNQCRTCHNDSEKNRRAYHRREHSDKEVAAFALRLKNAKTHKQVFTLCSLMMESYGGVAGFCRAWVGQHQRAQWDRPGTKRVLDSYLAAMRLFADCSTQQREADAVADEMDGLITDEDLNRRLADSLRELIQSDPTVAVPALQDLGWTIAPPA